MNGMFAADVGFGFYKYAAPTELKTDMPSSLFKTFRSTEYKSLVM